MNPVSSIDDDLIPLPDDEKHQYKEKSILYLTDLLRQIENKPIRYVDRKKLHQHFQEYFKFYDIKPDSTLYKQTSLRFAFEFIPGVTKLGLPALAEGETTALRIDDEIVGAVKVDASSVGATSVGSNTISPFSIPCNGTYFLCSIHRHKSTLSTTFRLYLDATKESNNAPVFFAEPTFVFGARKLKNGILIWAESDSKAWKDKNFIGKIIKHASNSQYVATSANRLEPNSGPSIAVSVNSNGVDKLIQIKAAALLLPNQPVDGEQREVDLSAALEQLSSGIHDVSNPNILFLRSLLPRKCESLGFHTVSFGKDSRMKVPSRKNIALEQMKQGSSNGNSGEWPTEKESSPPLLQLGKMLEEKFALDFHSISPFQAFAVALAIFDQ